MILALRLFMTPLLIASASLAGRRWGPGISGWLIGFPLNSAPVSVILSLQYGPEFAARAAIGNLGGLASICVYCLTYSVISQKMNWLLSAVMASAAFLITTFVWNSFTLSLLPTFIIAIATIALALWLIPQQNVPSNETSLPSWDIPARMIIATSFVLLLTTFASVLGPQLSGLITPFPIFGTVLATFAQQQQGADAARQLLRGMVLGLFGVAGFFLVVGGLLPTVGSMWTFTFATIITLSVNGISLHLSRRNNIPLYEQLDASA